MNNNLFDRSKLVVITISLMALLLAACGGGADAGQTELPTPIPAQDVGEEAGAAVGETHEETWTNYLNDSIAEQVKQRQTLISMRERYQHPSITDQELEYLITDIDFVSDNTEWNASNNFASALVNFDVRVTYANGDSETLTCQYEVQLEKYDDTGLWYVVGPEPLQVKANCQ